MKYFIQNFVYPWHIQNSVYSQICYILKSKHIQNPAEYLI